MVVYCMQDSSRYFREGKNAELNVYMVGMRRVVSNASAILSLLRQGGFNKYDTPVFKGRSYSG